MCCHAPLGQLGTIIIVEWKLIKRPSRILTRETKRYNTNTSRTVRYAACQSRKPNVLQRGYHRLHSSSIASYHRGYRRLGRKDHRSRNPNPNPIEQNPCRRRCWNDANLPISTTAVRQYLLSYDMIGTSSRTRNTTTYDFMKRLHETTTLHSLIHTYIHQLNLPLTDARSTACCALKYFKE